MNINFYFIAVNTSARLNISPTDPESDQPRRYALQVQIHPADPDQPRRCAHRPTSIFLSVPQIQSQISPQIRLPSPDPPRSSRSAPQMHRAGLHQYFYQSHRSRVRSASQIRPASPDPPRKSTSAPQMRPQAYVNIFVSPTDPESAESRRSALQVQICLTVPDQPRRSALQSPDAPRKSRSACRCAHKPTSIFLSVPQIQSHISKHHISTPQVQIRHEGPD